MNTRRRSIRIARYVNRYAHIPMVIIGQGVTAKGMRHAAYFAVRRQRKHAFGRGYAK